MALTVSIHQPQYLPWLPYLDKIDRADVFVYLDIVAYHKGGVQNRNSIHGASAPVLLTIPVAATLGERIMDVRIADDPKWARRHVQGLRQGYARAPHADRLAELETILSAPHAHLVDAAIATTEYLCRAFGITTRRVRASELAVSSDIHKDDLVLAIVKATGGDRYLSGQGARAYQDPQKFERAGVALEYQVYERVPYPQGMTAFEDALSAVDAVAHAADPRAVLHAGRRPAQPAHAETAHHEQL